MPLRRAVIFTSPPRGVEDCFLYYQIQLTPLVRFATVGQYHLMIMKKHAYEKTLAWAWLESDQQQGMHPHQSALVKPAVLHSSSGKVQPNNQFNMKRIYSCCLCHTLAE